MKIRTVLYLMFGAVIVAVLSILYVTNQAVLDSRLILSRGIQMPVWFALLLASGVSMLVRVYCNSLRRSLDRSVPRNIASYANK